MAQESLSDTFLKSGVVHEIGWADNVMVTLPDDYLPFQHQYEGINLCCIHNRAALWDEAGTGKTLSIQASALWYVGHFNKVVVLTKPTLLDQFYADFFKTFKGIEHYVDIDILRGDPKQRIGKLEKYNQHGWPDIIIMSYDLFRGTKPPKKKVPKGEPQPKTKVNIKDIGYHETLKKNGYDVLIADEAQQLRTPGSTIHKRVWSWIGMHNTEKKALIMASATPSHTNPSQCYGLIKLKSPELYGSKANYDRLHVVRDDSPFKSIVGYDNLDLLALNLYKHARRVEKRDVRDDMPPLINTIVPVELSPEHKKLYKRLMDERILEVGGKMIDAVQDQTLRQTALQLVTNPQKYSDTKIHNVLEDILFDQLESIDLEQTKVVVFIHYNDVAEHLKELLKAYNPVILNGHTRNKGKTVDTFKEDDKCRILIAHAQSGGAGLNLQSVCYNYIFYECPESPGDLDQAQNRAHRIVGTENPVNSIFISPKNTWAAKKIRRLVEGAKVINSVIGDTDALLADLYDETS